MCIILTELYHIIITYTIKLYCNVLYKIIEKKAGPVRVGAQDEGGGLVCVCVCVRTCVVCVHAVLIKTP